MPLQEKYSQTPTVETNHDVLALRDQLPESLHERYDALSERYDVLRAAYGEQALDLLPAAASNSLSGLLKRPPYSTEIRDGIEARTERLYTSPAHAAQFNVAGTLDPYVERYKLRPASTRPGEAMSPYERREYEAKRKALGALDAAARAELVKYRSELAKHVRDGYAAERTDSFVKMMAVRNLDSKVTEISRSDFDEQFQPFKHDLETALQQRAAKNISRTLFKRPRNDAATETSEPALAALEQFEAALEAADGAGLSRSTIAKVEHYVSQLVMDGENSKDIRAVIQDKLQTVGEGVSERAFVKEVSAYITEKVLPDLRAKKLIDESAPGAAGEYVQDPTKAAVGFLVNELRSQGLTDDQIFSKLARKYHPDSTQLDTTSGIDLDKAYEELRRQTGK